MTSVPTPTPPADWGTLMPRLHRGDRVCMTHGRVRAEQAPIGIPICSVCSHMLHTVQFDRAGRLAGFAEPIPTVCSAAEQHLLGPGTVLLGWRACLCEHTEPGPSGHRIWTCRQCLALGRPDHLSQKSWPPCATGTAPGR